MLKKTKIAATKLARADTVFILLPPLMALLVVGTLAQKPLGLYAAQKMFFGSFFFWLGPFPLPGGYTLIGIIAFSLAVKFFLYSEWTLRRAGINLAHFGILVLLFGELVTAILAHEGFMVLPEGSEGQYVYDYHQRELYIFENNALKRTIPFADLNLRITGLPFEMDIRNSCGNCTIVKRENEGDYKGMAQFMTLKAIDPGKDPESDLPGLTFHIKGLGDQDGTYIAFEGMPNPVTLYVKDSEYKIIFGKQQRLLPFSLRLVKFTRDVYPGTDKPRGYSSDVVIMDNGVEWPARIAMNEPLRYKGYTFYQSSFEQNKTMQASILSVVENKGRLFPYIATGIIAAGLLLHVVLVLRGRA